jgi:Transposase DDE domain
MARRLKTSKKSRKQKPTQKLTANPDLRPRSTCPLPSIAEIEHRLRAVLTPGLFAARRLAGGTVKLRDRLLTLPVMAVLVVSLVWRQVPSLSEALRVVAREGLWDFAPFVVSRQALSQRLRALPAQLFAQLYEDALGRLRQTRLTDPPAADSVRARFTALGAADGSTLEALRRKLKELREPQMPLGGKMLAVVDLLTRRPQQTWDTAQPQANDKTFCAQLGAALPVGGLVVVDLGWFSFPFFDALTEAGKYFVTRLRAKTAYQVVAVLGASAHWRDEVLALGAYRSNPCRHRVRRVSVLWGTTWYHYLTNVLDPQLLSAREVCELYRRRWRIEETFLVTKRLLGLAYLWVGDRNGVEIQLYATWLFYAVLADLCDQVAEALDQPLEKISVEMVFRSLYHFARAIDSGESPELVPFLVHHAKLFGLVKADRNRHKERQQQDLEIWGTS